MADNFEFDDDDDVLLNAISCTPPNAALEKRLSEENSENLPLKRPKLGGSESPIIQFTKNSQSCTKESEKLIKSTLSPNVSKRIFPGPAGILLDENQTDICSQDTFSFFQDGPWEEMSKDFKISNNSHLYDKFNIAWIKKEAIGKKLVNQKAPFLAAILLSLEVSDSHAQKNINVALKDKTGTIQGTILQNLYEEHAGHFTLGSVLVLLQFGILSCTCDKCDNHHLTITPKNLCAIYSGKEKLVIKQVDPEDVLKEYIEKRKEFELDRLKKTHRQNLLNSPKHGGALSHRPVPFQSPCTSTTNSLKPSQTFVSPMLRTLDIRSAQKTVNERAYDTDSPCASRTDSLKPSQTFVPPTVRIFDKSSSQKEAQDEYSPGNAVKRLFSFKKIPIEAKVEENLTNTQELLRNFTEQVDAITTKECTETKQEEESKVETEEIEHEKIWKDVLEDVDVNSFFDEDF